MKTAAASRTLTMVRTLLRNPLSGDVVCCSLRQVEEIMNSKDLKIG